MEELERFNFKEKVFTVAVLREFTKERYFLKSHIKSSYLDIFPELHIVAHTGFWKNPFDEG